MKTNLISPSFLSSESCEGSLGADDLIARAHEDFGAQGEEKVDTRAEFDESELCILDCLVARVAVIYYAAGDVPRDLAEQYVVASRIDHRRGAFVLFGRFRMPRHKVFAMVVVKIQHAPRNGMPIYVNVCYRHENRYLDAARMQEFVLLDLFYDDYFAVRGREYRIGVEQVFSAGLAKERRNSHGYQGEYAAYKPKRPKRPQTSGDQVCRHAEKYDATDERPAYDSVPLLMYFHEVLFFRFHTLMTTTIMPAMAIKTQR